MAKISALPLLAAPTGAEAVVVLDGDTTRRARIDQIAEAAVASQVARAEAAADAADTTVASVRPALSQPCAAIVGADANRWRMSFPDGQNVLVDQGIYRFPAPSTPTGPITVEVIGGPVVDLRYDNGSRVGAEAGITAPWEVAIRWDLKGGANVFRLQSSAFNLPRLAEALTIGDATKGLRDLTANPWGTFPGNARVPIDVVFTGCGSSVFTDSAASVGRQGGAPEGQPPLAVLCGMANARWPGGGVRFMPDDRSHGGHVLGQFLGQLAESPAWNAGSTRFVLVGAGMNDWQVSQFDTNQTFPNARANTIALIEAAKAKNAKVLLCTSMHPQTQIYDYAGFFRTNTGYRAMYPRDLPGPVDPETGQFPPASASVAMRDMTGSGIATPCDLRFWAGNRMLREVARLYPHDVILLDVEWSWFRYGIEVHGVAALYDAGQFVHPNLLGHQVSIHRVLREFADDLTAGRALRPMYLGDRFFVG